MPIAQAFEIPRKSFNIPQSCSHRGWKGENKFRVWCYGGTVLKSVSGKNIVLGGVTATNFTHPLRFQLSTLNPLPLPRYYTINGEASQVCLSKGTEAVTSEVPLEVPVVDVSVRGVA